MILQGWWGIWVRRAMPRETEHPALGGS